MERAREGSDLHMIGLFIHRLHEPFTEVADLERLSEFRMEEKRRVCIDVSPDLR